MFDDDDPYLARVRQICLALPDASEKVAHGRPTFRTGKVFAVYGGGTKGPAGTRTMYPHSLLLMPDPNEAPALVEAENYFLPAYYGPWGWIGWDLARAGTTPQDVDWAEIFELVDSSYREVSTPAQVVRLDGAGLDPTSFS